MIDARIFEGIVYKVSVSSARRYLSKGEAELNNLALTFVCL